MSALGTKQTFTLVCFTHILLLSYLKLSTGLVHCEANLEFSALQHPRFSNSHIKRVITIPFIIKKTYFLVLLTYSAYLNLLVLSPF